MSTMNLQVYDDVLFDSLMRDFCDGDFYNMGWWGDDTLDLNTAAYELVKRTLARIEGAPMRVLDAGCGLGGGTREISRRWPHADVTGINISSRQLTRCGTVAPHCTFVNMDAAALTFDSNTFDAILCVESALHFDTRVAFFAHARRVLRPGGTLAIADLLYNTSDWPGGWTVPTDNLCGGVEEFTELLHRAGFDRIDVTDVTEWTWRVYAKRFRAFLETLAPDSEDATFWLTSFKRVFDVSPPVYVLASARVPA